MSAAFPISEQMDDRMACRIVFSSTMENVDLACQKAAGFLLAACPGTSPHMFAINLVLREGLTNAVRHGNRGCPGKKIILDLDLSLPGELLIRIEDEGEGFNWKKAAVASFPQDADHGRGMVIMEKYFSSMHYNARGNVLFLKKILDS